MTAPISNRPDPRVPPPPSQPTSAEVMMKSLSNDKPNAIDPSVAAVTQLLTSLFGDGVWTEDDPYSTKVWDDSAQQTAERWIKALKEFRADGDIDFNFTTFPAVANQMIVVPNIHFSSLCAHHLFPFEGVAHVGYLPNVLMVGLSKIPRAVRHFSHRPQTQERLTRQIASFLKKRLEAQGVAVVLKATHTCSTCRGIEAVGSSMVTSEMRGSFLTSGDARAEFLHAIDMGAQG